MPLNGLDMGYRIAPKGHMFWVLRITTTRTKELDHAGTSAWYQASTSGSKHPNKEYLAQAMIVVPYMSHGKYLW